MPLNEAKASESGWANIVTHELGGGWTKIESYAHDAGHGWQLLPEAGLWVWVYQPDTEPPSAPEGMVLVEGGTLSMSMGTRTVETFYIGGYEVTWGEWQTVRTWAAANGYDIGSVGLGCAADHPVHMVS